MSDQVAVNQERVYWNNSRQEINKHEMLMSGKYMN